MSGEAHVTIRFRTTLPVAMVADWPAALGLLNPKLHRDLEISDLEVEINGETRIGPDTNIAAYHGGTQVLDPFTAPVLVTLRRLLCFFPNRRWQVTANGPWLSVDFEPAWGEEATEENAKRSFAIWLHTGEAYRVIDGAADDDPIALDELDPEKDRL
jgi:hypothetical protein